MRIRKSSHSFFRAKFFKSEKKGWSSGSYEPHVPEAGIETRLVPVHRRLMLLTFGQILPKCDSEEYRATDEALRRERALTFDESDGHAMKVDACDACPYCHDTCADPDCPRCAVWRLRPRKMCRGCAVFSPCEVRRHASAESCWLVAGRDVFDVTSFLPRHPAGTRSIVRKAGGADCTEDLGFHSAKAQKLWMQHKIGRLEPCGAEKNPENGCAVA